ncbi:MAG: NAD(P)/FAD-dependent oxidoreductase [Alphaproteobacteria bacterium]|nr:NAD(P)/FAD-dependent oxidoreductase [Alphaproteobacteria bacterium]
MHIVCIGAGPAGLTAAYQLTKAGCRVTVLEKDPVYVGGISRTVRYKGFGFDIGGHRFFSKSPEIEQLWEEILGDDFLQRPRKSRIYYGGKFYPYPLKGWQTLRQMGAVASIACVLSYLRARLSPIPAPQNFEDWVINHFGRRLYGIFFKTYTEKVWGMDCREISVDWAAQRIKGLSLSSAILHMLPFKRPQSGSGVIKTLIHTFRYPRQGPGMMWEKAAALVRRQGGEVLQGAEVEHLVHPADGQWEITYRGKDYQACRITADYVIASLPLRELVAMIEPPLPEEARRAAGELRYRDFLIVALVVRDKNVFDDNWIYIHDPGVKVGRIQNFKAWSPELVPDPALNCYGMEYFCFEGDGLWNSPDQQLIELARSELIRLKLADGGDIVDGTVVRQAKAYPVYDQGYAERVKIIRRALERHCPRLYPVGRAGMHKYNNQDHAMMTAMLAARNILAGEEIYDVWNVNQDAEYHEEASGAVRAVPQRAA